jgi:hypothetical protein
VIEPPPNESLASLAEVLGNDATREIVRLFVQGFPEAYRCLGAGTADDRLRTVHGLKSSALLMGATKMSQRMAAVETRLAGGESLTEGDLGSILSDFGAAAPALRRYAGI